MFKRIYFTLPNKTHCNITRLTLTHLIFLILYSCSINNQDIDLSNVEGQGLIESIVSNLTPDSSGIMESRLLILPSYEKGVYYSPYVEKHNIGNRFYGIEFTNLEHLRKQRISLEAKQPYEDFDMGSFICLKINADRYLSILAMAGEDVFSSFTIRNDGMWVDAGTFGTDEFSGILPMVAYAYGTTPYLSSHNVWTTALKSKSLKTKTTFRHKKKYPEPFEYVGYCTFEHLLGTTPPTEKILVDIIQDMEEAPIPLRWMLIDDGYENHEDYHLLSYQPDATKFPNGFEPLTSLKKEDKVKWIGLWWYMGGYYNGISPNHTIDGLDQHLFRLKDDFLLPKTNARSTDFFFESRAKEMKDAGIDFIKVDFQTRLFKDYRGQPNPVLAASHNHRALERVSDIYFDALLNCIAQHHLHLFKHEKSSVIRSSIDYKRNDDNNSFIAIQSLRNSLYLGVTHWLDHDMYISSYHTGQSGAEVRAISGSPLYISEDIAAVDYESIQPAVWDNGEIIRPLAPGTLMPEGFFEDPAVTGLRVISPLNGKVASFWLANFHNEKELSIALTPDDYKYGGAMIQPYDGLWQQPEEGLVAYDYHEERAWKMNQNISFTLPKWATKIIHLIPINKGWAIIGRPDKYLSPESCPANIVTAHQITFELRESAPFLIWSENGSLHSDEAKITSNRDHLYLVVPTSKDKRSITIHRTL